MTDAAGTSWFQLIPVSACWFQLVPDGSRWLSKAQDISTPGNANPIRGVSGTSVKASLRNSGKHQERRNNARGGGRSRRTHQSRRREETLGAGETPKQNCSLSRSWSKKLNRHRKQVCFWWVEEPTLEQLSVKQGAEKEKQPQSADPYLPHSPWPPWGEGTGDQNLSGGELRCFSQVCVCLLMVVVFFFHSFFFFFFFNIIVQLEVWKFANWQYIKVIEIPHLETFPWLW